MRITIVISSLGCGGAERLAVVMANYWAVRGRQVSLVTFSPPDEKPFFKLDSAVVQRPLGLTGRSSNIATAVSRNLWRLFKLRRAIREERPDVIISFMEQTNVSTVLATFGLSIPLIISEHSVPNIQNPGPVWSMLRRLVYPMADSLVVQSPEVRDFFRPWYERSKAASSALRFLGLNRQSRVRAPVIIPNAVQFEAADGSEAVGEELSTQKLPERKSTGRIIGAAGRLSQEKGFDLLLRAFAIVAQKHSGVSLSIWGDGPLRSELEALRDSLGLAARVTFHGNLNPLSAGLIQCELLVLSSRYEGFGNVLLEAMALGLPVVSFDCPWGPRQIIRDGIDGLLAKNGDLQSLAAEIGRMLDHDDLRKRLGESAREVVNRFGPAQVMPLWDDLILSVVKPVGAEQEPAGPAKHASQPRCCFLIRRLDFGGAERQLLELVRTLPLKGVAPVVITFYDGGGLATAIKRMKGVHHISLHKSGRWDILGFSWRLIWVLRRLSPEIVHGYLIVPNLLVVLMRPIIKTRAVVVWGYRTSHTNFESHDWLGRLLLRLEAKLSHFADLIIVNSAAGREDAARRGFPQAKLTMVRNGIDVERFRPAPELGLPLRRDWGVEKNEPLIGLIGRLDPMKQHDLYLRAATVFYANTRSGKFLCCGDGPDGYRKKLRLLASELGIESRIIWTGSREDVSAVYNALDICVLCSNRAEGYPNVIAEAMACGVPCVTTDCGDAAMIVDGLGIVVSEPDPATLAQAWQRCLKQDRGTISPQLRTRIVDDFSTEQLAERTLAALGSLSPSVNAACSRSAL